MTNPSIPKPLPKTQPSDKRTCTICGCTLPATTGFFSPVNAEGNLRSFCITCERHRHRQQYRENTPYTAWAKVQWTDDRVLAAVVANCHCSSCGNDYAPFVELWANETTCAFCSADAKAVSHE